MQPSASRSIAPNHPPDCLMTVLDFGLGAIGSCDGDVFEKIRQRCAACDSREYCELALRRARFDLALSGLFSMP